MNTWRRGAKNIKDVMLYAGAVDFNRWGRRGVWDRVIDVRRRRSHSLATRGGIRRQSWVVVQRYLASTHETKEGGTVLL